MKKIESYDEIAALIAAQFRRGMVTNAFLAREDYERELRAGALRAESWAGGLVILRRRAGYDRMNFYLTDPATPCPAEFPMPAVMEIAAREKDAALHAAAEYWEGLGFSELFSRSRLKRAAAPTDCSPAAPAAASDAPAVQTLMNACFHPMAGCLLTDEELAAAIAAGQILCARDDGGEICGVLHYTQGRRTSELRHLAVRVDARRRGVAAALFNSYIAATDGGASLVWVRRGNDPAEEFYKKCAYEPDGWTSVVLART